MQRSLFDEQIIEVTGSSNTAYILKNHDMFYDIGFRVMKNQKSGSIMECHQLKYNGKYKFVFFTDEYTRLSDLLSKADSDHFMVIISNLIRSIEDIQSTGFLNVACIDNRLDHIFVDNRTMSVRLIYLPINIPMNGVKKAEFENDIRAQLLKLIENHSNAESGAFKELKSILRDGNVLSLSEVARKLQVSPVAQHIMHTAPEQPNPVQSAPPQPVQQLVQQSTYAAPQPQQPVQVQPEPVVRTAPVQNVQPQPVYTAPQPTYTAPQPTAPSSQLILISDAAKENIVITKNRFLIGKSADKVDGVINGNTAVSRIHCEIVINDLGVITIMDKGSANGTFVNGLRIGTDQYTTLRINDRVKIANEEYILVRR